MHLSTINPFLKKPALILALLGLTFLGHSQARWILNDDVYLNIGGNSNLVIENGNGNAIAQINKGGSIISEDERNVIKWNIGSSTGNYIIPFANPDFIKIPVEIRITYPGDTKGSLFLSTYRTDNMNSKWPSVTPEVTICVRFSILLMHPTMS